MKILLHSCCGPCSIYPLKVLRQAGYKISCLFYNPNIHPYKEFRRRLTTFTEYMDEEEISFSSDNDYGLIEFTRKTAFNETSRCSICYTMRMSKTAQHAAENGFDAFTTTLLYSKYQQHDKIVALCKKLADQYKIDFFYEDFRVGWQEGIDGSIKQGMYRQPYCGCIYSEQERYDKKLKKSRKKNGIPA